VVTGTLVQPVLHASGSENAPDAYGEAETLAWIRERLLYVIDTFRPMAAAVRYAERNARGANKDSAKARCRVEGVVLEAIATRNLRSVTGTLSTFEKHQGAHSAKADLTSDYLRGLNWSNYRDRNEGAMFEFAAPLDINQEN
jgi:hypothetical protein